MEEIRKRTPEDPQEENRSVRDWQALGEILHVITLTSEVRDPTVNRDGSKLVDFHRLLLCGSKFEKSLLFVAIPSECQRECFDSVWRFSLFRIPIKAIDRH